MANNSRVSRSASIEDLREKNAQIEAEVSKLADDVREVMRKQEEGSRRQEEGQRRLEESNRVLEDKLNNLGMILERAIRQIGGKGPGVHDAEASTSNGRRGNREGVNRNPIGEFGERNADEGMNPNSDLNSEEFDWTEAQLRNRERERGARVDNRRGIQLPRLDFPYFDGIDPKEWRARCEQYFEIYEVPAVYKTRMALINFSEDVLEWYGCLVSGGPPLPWDILIEDVLARFLNYNVKDPVDEFKRLHQVGKVEEYIKKFDKAKARLLIEKPALDEGFFVSGFISGLKEEVRFMVEMFNPRALNSVYKCALKAESTYEAQNRKPKDNNKGYKFQKYPVSKPKPEAEKPVVRENQYARQWPAKPNNQTPTYEQRKELGLCHKCHGKYFPGHQCNGKLLKLTDDSDSEGGKSEKEGEVLDSDEDEASAELVEQAVLSMFHETEKGKVSSMKFKGYIGKFPICALVDSGSTHSFVHPSIIKGLKIPTEKTNPMVVKVANGDTMVTDLVCRNLKFNLQGNDFEKEVRLLAVQGYEVILGLDWLHSSGPMRIDWSKGTVEFKWKDKKVKLRVNEKEAEIRIMESYLDVDKEIKKGSEVLIAQFYKIEEKEKGT